MKPTHHTDHPIRRARKARGWSQAELGRRLSPNATKGAVSQWEQGTTKPTPDTAVQLVGLFGGEVSLDDLYKQQGRAH